MTSNYFDITMQIIVVINIIPISMDFIIDETYPDADDWFVALQVTLVNISQRGDPNAVQGRFFKIARKSRPMVLREIQCRFLLFFR